MQESPFKRHEPLYLKYRPQSLGQLVGQEGVKRTLINAIEHSRLTHAYLFTGPRGTGKTSSARILAKSLNCKTAGRPTIEPCQNCASCLEVTESRSPAVFEIDAASNNSVDDARLLIERAPIKAVGSEFKVYIIDECHMLTKEAFNALLKTIEQPPPGVVFILATTEEHKVLPTIVSRCQRLMFKLINQGDLLQHLRYVSRQENIEIEDEALHLIARRSGGGLRDALSNLDQASLLSSPGSPATVADLLRLLGALHEDVLLDLSKQLAERSGQSVIDTVEKLLSEGREPQVVLQELTRHFLNLVKASNISGSRNRDGLASVVLGSEAYIEGLHSQSTMFEACELSQIVERLNMLEQTCRRSTQPAMQLEIGLLSICHRHDVHSIRELSERIQKLEEILAQASAENLPLYQKIPHSQPKHSQAQTIGPQAVKQDGGPGRDATAMTQSPLQTTRVSASSLGDKPEHEYGGEAEIAGDKLTNAVTKVEAQHLAEADSKSGGATDFERLGADETESAPPARRDLAKQSQSPAELQPDSAESLPGKVDARISELAADLDYLWQQILDELQSRHIPTYSLASTHAFPLSLDAKELCLGVLKENFQKMLESKIDHLRAACRTITGLDLLLRIRVAEKNLPGKKVLAAAATSPSRAPGRKQETELEAEEDTRSGAGSRSEYQDALTEEAASPAAEKDPEAKATEKGEFDATMVKEAYKLFEGPGSRRIT